MHRVQRSNSAVGGNTATESLLVLGAMLSHFALLPQCCVCSRACTLWWAVVAAGHGLPPALAAPGGAAVLDQLHAMQDAQAATQVQLAAAQAQLAATQAQLAATQAQLAAMQAAAQDAAVAVGHRFDALENVEAMRVNAAAFTVGGGPLRAIVVNGTSPGPSASCVAPH